MPIDRHDKISCIANMSPLDYKTVKLSRNEARKRITEIMTKHPDRVHFTGHAEKALQDDRLTTGDALNLLKSSSGRINEEGEFHNGSWRYRLSTTHMVVVVAFEPTDLVLNVVTCWDKRKREQAK